MTSAYGLASLGPGRILPGVFNMGFIGILGVHRSASILDTYDYRVTRWARGLCDTRGET